MNNDQWESYFTLPESLVPVVESISKLSKESSKDEWIDCLMNLQKEEYTRYLCNDGEDSNGLFPNRRWTFQHHAAYHSAPEDVIKTMVKMGFPMSYKDGDKKLPLDYIAAGMTDEYRRLFKFTFENLDISKVNNIEQQFHNVIHLRADELVKEHNLILPVLSVVLECPPVEKSLLNVYCAIPGMYGGFSFSFEFSEDQSDVESLVTDSWIRVCGGSGQRHNCTENDFTLVEEGFC